MKRRIKPSTVARGEGKKVGFTMSNEVSPCQSPSRNTIPAVDSILPVESAVRPLSVSGIATSYYDGAPEGMTVPSGACQVIALLHRNDADDGAAIEGPPILRSVGGNGIGGTEAVGNESATALPSLHEVVDDSCRPILGQPLIHCIGPDVI